MEDDFTLPVEMPQKRRRLSPPTVPSTLPVEQQAWPEDFPEEMSELIVTHLDAPSLANFRLQSTQMARIGKPFLTPSCMNQLMTTVSDDALRQTLRASKDQSPEALSRIIKQLAVRVQPHVNPGGATVWEGTPAWENGPVVHLRFTTQNPKSEQEQQQLLSGSNNRGVLLSVQTRNNPAFKGLKPLPTSWWNALCYFTPWAQDYWNAFALQTAHCHMQNKFAVNPILAQVVFVFEARPDFNTTLMLNNGHVLRRVPEDFRALTDLEMVKWLYCAISLAEMLFNEIGFVSSHFFKNLRYTKLAVPISMFGIETNIVPIKSLAHGELVYCTSTGLGPTLPTAGQAGDVLWLHSDLRNLLNRQLLNVALRIPENMAGQNLDALRLLNNWDIESAFPMLREMLWEFQIRHDQVRSYSKTDFLNFLKQNIQSRQNTLADENLPVQVTESAAA